MPANLPRRTSTRRPRTPSLEARQHGREGLMYYKPRLEWLEDRTAPSIDLTIVPASSITGPDVIRPGFAAPQGSARPYDATSNIAVQGNGYAQAAVAKDNIAGYANIHQPQYVNDGYYGNGASWISNSPNSWIKLDLGRVVEITTLRFGRDRTGNFNDRDPGQFTISVALADNTYANGNDSNDASEYVPVFSSSSLGFGGIINGAETWQSSFTPIAARYVKMTVANAGACIDEIEIRANATGGNPPPSEAPAMLLVPGTANPFLADPANVPGPDPYDGTMPLFIPVVGGTILQFDVSGVTGNFPSGSFAPNPDGIQTIYQASGPLRGISRYQFPLNSLIGVFLGPTIGATPGQLSSDIQFTTVSPLLGQVFFIGDGLTGTGSGIRQTFNVPAGATKLYLASEDGHEWGNNSGGYVVTVNPGSNDCRVLLQDDFNDNALDATKWTTDTNIPRGPASVTERSQRLELVNRGHLISHDQFDPAAVGPLHITGRWTFLDASWPDHDMLQILTRSDGIPGPSFSETNNGIEFHANGNDFITISEHVDIQFTTIGAAVPITINDGDSFTFDIFDDGTNLAFTLTRIGGNKETASVIAQSSRRFAKNHIVFHNREANNGNGNEFAYLDDLVVNSCRADTPALPPYPQETLSFTASASSDGTLEGRAGTYSVARNGPTGTVITEHIQIGQQWWIFGGQFLVWRGALTFDTSAIPDNAVITSATIKLRGFDKIDVTNLKPELHLVPLSVDDPTVLEPQDYAGYGSESLGSISYGDFSTTSYNSLPLNEMGIQRIDAGGLTTFGLRIDHEIAGAAPLTSGNNAYAFYAHGAEAVGQEPILEVTWIADTSQRDIAVLSAALKNATTVDFSYELSGSVPSFEVGLYRSADTSIDAFDELIATQVFLNDSGAATFSRTLHLSEPVVIDASKPHVILVLDSTSATNPQGQIAEANEGNNVALAYSMPLVVNVLTHGWNPDPRPDSWEAFRELWLEDWKNLLEGIPAEGSLLDGRVKSYVTQWDSSRSFTLGVGALVLATLADRINTIPLIPPDWKLALSGIEGAAKLAALVFGLDSRQAAAEAAEKVVADLKNQMLLISPNESNAHQQIHLIGHSRGASVNAKVSQLLADEGYTNVAQFTSLDGFAGDWPGDSWLLLEHPISDAVANRKVNYRVQEGLAGLIVSSLIPDDLEQSGFGPFISSTLESALTVAIGDFRAPRRVGFDNIGLLDFPARDGWDSDVDHTSITKAYFGSLTFEPEYQYVRDNYVGWHRLDGLAPTGETALQQGEFYSADTSGDLTAVSSAAKVGLAGFVDGGFELLGDLLAKARETVHEALGETWLDLWLERLGDGVEVLSFLWDFAGLVDLIPNNSSVQLTQTAEGTTWLSQRVFLDAGTSSMSFDLSVLDAGADDGLRIYLDDSMIGDIPLSAAVGGMQSVSLPPIGSGYATLKFELVGPSGDPSVVRLDNLTVGVRNHLPITTDDFATVQAGTVFQSVASVLDNDLDPENLPLDVLVTSATSHGSLVVDRLGRFEYTPINGFVGTERFTYRAIDAQGTPSSETTVWIDVINLAPEFVLRPSGNRSGDVQVSGAFLDHRLDQAHTVEISWGDGSPSTVLELEPGARSFTATHPYVPTGSASFAGVYTITATVRDDDGGEGTASATVAVAAGKGSYKLGLSADGTSMELRRGSTLLVSELAGSVQQVIIVGATHLDDSLTVDLTYGNPLPAFGVGYCGGGDDFDQLKIIGGAVERTVYSYDGHESGSVELEEPSTAGPVTRVIYFQNVHAVTTTTAAREAVFNLPEDDNDAWIQPAGGSLTLNPADPPWAPVHTFVPTKFIRPSQSLTVNGRGGDDQFDITGGSSITLPGVVVVNAESTEIALIHTANLNIGTMVVQGDLLITGLGKINGVAVQVHGNVTSQDQTLAGTSTISLVGDQDQTLSGAGVWGQLPHLDVSKTGGTVTVLSDIGVRGNLAGSGGVFAPSDAYVVLQEWDSTINFSGPVTLWNLEIYKIYTAGVTLLSDLDVRGDFRFTLGKALDLGAFRAAVGGDMFVHAGATLVFAIDVAQPPVTPRLDVGGALEFSAGATLKVKTGGSTGPSSGGSFELIRAGALLGFSGVNVDLTDAIDALFADADSLFLDLA